MSCPWLLLLADSDPGSEIPGDTKKNLLLPVTAKRDKPMKK